jgi:hypothetical protein
VQNACKLAPIHLQPPSATPSSTLPVVSEWYQKARSYRAFLALIGAWANLRLDSAKVPSFVGEPQATRNIRGNRGNANE